MFCGLHKLNQYQNSQKNNKTKTVKKGKKFDK